MNLSEQLKVSIEAMNKYYDKKQKSIKLVKKVKLVLLNRKNISSKFQSTKLEAKMYESVEVVVVERYQRYRKLELPD